MNRFDAEFQFVEQPVIRLTARRGWEVVGQVRDGKLRLRLDGWSNSAQ